MLLVASYFLATERLFAGQLPSLFRGITVTDGEFGVRIVSVEDTSLAYHADLRPEDIILQVDGTPIKSIEEFASLSLALKGRAAKATVLVLRNGQPREVHLHLASDELSTQWGLTFVPDYDLRFADPRAGVSYWMNLARGFEAAGDAGQALNASLNALHNDPTNVSVATEVSSLLSRTAQDHLAHHRLAEAVTSLQDATTLMEHLFDHPLDDAQLARIKTQLEDALKALRSARQQHS